MTKNDLINLMYSLEIDLKYQKRDLQFRLDGNAFVLLAYAKNLSKQLNMQ